MPLFTNSCGEPKKAEVDLENAIVHIADSKTVNGIGDMPMTPEAREAFQRQIDVRCQLLFPVGDNYFSLSTTITSFTN
jgi:hypothetical protein